MDGLDPKEITLLKETLKALEPLITERKKAGTAPLLTFNELYSHVTAEKVAFLEQMAATYGLPDVGKAVRCLVNYARENPDKHEAIFAEVRCLDC